jgi:hypothetical protein
MARLPKGYVGTKHETIGSDILSVVKSLKLPELTLGKEMAEELSHVEPTRWYPIKLLLDAMAKIDARLGADGLRQMGRLLFKMSHADRVGPAPAARDIIYGLDGMYHHANRGQDIGGWKVLLFEAGRAELEKTTPHYCMMEEGILGAALTTTGVSPRITQRQCFRQGAECCIFVVESPIRDERWSGKPA